jgi:subtilisin family serine protease
MGGFMLLKGLISVCVSGLIASSASAETMIVKFDKNFNTKNFKFMGVTKLEPVVPELGIYSIDVPVSKNGSRAALTSLRSVKGVKYAQEDHPVTQRAVPNDKSFKQQWDMLLDNQNFGIDAISAWNNFGQGGTDAAGNDIVVAVVDGGVDVDHEDLAQNIWVNAGEIPGNKKDDDGNGYIDDINGWNAFNNSGAVASDYHGTHVAGTVGAVGNNGIHGAGVNWNVKLMAINGSSGTTSVVLKAYGYVLKQKQLWVSSGGKQGANVVATNSSFGVDYGDCKSGSFPAWNDIYNEMGKVGVLHAIATANIGMDIDKNGDVPTGCDSEFIIAVTNTEKNGNKNNGAGFGLTTIDIGAPGTNIFSTIENNGWGSLTGTSMATPHVAGAVAYMHSAGSKAFNDMYLKDPAKGALALKEVMLKTVTPAASMKGKTVSGGILNINQAGLAMKDYVTAQ